MPWFGGDLNQIACSTINIEVHRHRYLSIWITVDVNRNFSVG